MSGRTKLTAGATALARPLLLGGGPAGASHVTGQITHTDGSGRRITCDYCEGGIVGDAHQATAYTENSINQQTAPGCEAEMVLTVTYIDIDIEGKRRRHSASSVEGRSLFPHSFDVASDHVATHDIYCLSCQKPDPGDACSVRFTTK